MQYIDKVIDVCCAGPAVLGCSRGGDSRAPTVAALTKSLTCPLCATTGAVVVDVLAQFIDGYGRPCAYAATSGLSLWRCLRLSSSPELVDIPVAENRGLRPGFCGGDVGLGIFRAPPGRPGFERQFSEPSMTKSSLLSRALAN